MVSPTWWFARWARSVSVGLWVTLTAIAAHQFGDGGALSPVALMPVVAVTTTVAWWASRRRLTTPVVVGLLAIPQILIHLMSGYVHGHLMVPSLPMLAAHVVSIGITAAALTHVERLWWALWQWCRRTLDIPAFDIDLIAAHPQPRKVLALVGSPLLAGAITRRGPPVF
jgi:hypothetical protein